MDMTYEENYVEPIQEKADQHRSAQTEETSLKLVDIPGKIQSDQLQEK